MHVCQLITVRPTYAEKIQIFWIVCVSNESDQKIGGLQKYIKNWHGIIFERFLFLPSFYIDVGHQCSLYSLLNLYSTYMLRMSNLTFCSGGGGMYTYEYYMGLYNSIRYRIRLNRLDFIHFSAKGIYFLSNLLTNIGLIWDVIQSNIGSRVSEWGEMSQSSGGFRVWWRGRIFVVEFLDSNRCFTSVHHSSFFVGDFFGQSYIVLCSFNVLTCIIVYRGLNGINRYRYLSS